MSNNNVLDNLKMWNVEYDPCGFLFNDDWLEDQHEEEDVLQLVHRVADSLSINVGRYEKGVYKIDVVEKDDWENPKAEFESDEKDIVTQKVYEYVELFAKRPLV